MAGGLLKARGAGKVAVGRGPHGTSQAAHLRDTGQRTEEPGTGEETQEQLKTREKRGKDLAHWDREKGGAVIGEVGGRDPAARKGRGLQGWDLDPGRGGALVEGGPGSPKGAEHRGGAAPGA